MTRSGLLIVFSMFLALSTGSLAATLHESSLIRREAKSAHDSQPKENQQDVTANEPCAGCHMWDYMLGKPNSNECNHPENETLVTDDIMCRYAAGRSNAHADPEHIFKLNINDPVVIETRPHGCFRFNCHPGGDADEVERPCFFVSEGTREESNETHPDFKGTPICKRKMFRDGATGAQDGCPDAYKVIADRARCQEVCNEEIEEVDYKCNEFFNIGEKNFSQHESFPKGCFHLTEAGFHRVYWNSYSTAADVSGTVMCQVEAPLRFEDVEEAADDSGTTAAPEAQ